jgi:hypothetical protein
MPLHHDFNQRLRRDVDVEPFGPMKRRNSPREEQRRRFFTHFLHCAWFFAEQPKERQRRREGEAVTIRCAWCEQEGRQPAIRQFDPQAHDPEVVTPESHGICDGHRLLFMHMLESSMTT